MKERILLMGSPGTGKSQQLINIVNFVGTNVYVVDLEDKLSAMLERTGIPKNMKLQTAFTWEELKADENSVFDQIMKQATPGEWIAIDRVDLAWSFVQKWYTENKYQQELADVMMEKAKGIKKSFMVAPRFDQGSWQVINAAYEGFITGILYRSRCNILLTCGIAEVDQNQSNPLDAYGNIRVKPRGQKELGHQPHSVFLLTQEKVGRKSAWYLTTAKDLPGRVLFDKEDLFDFAFQYLSEHYNP